VGVSACVGRCVCVCGWVGVAIAQCANARDVYALLLKLYYDVPHILYH